MSRTPGRFTQADVARAIRAAQQTGAGPVEIKRDGTICVSLSPQVTVSGPESPPLDNEVRVKL